MSNMERRYLKSTEIRLKSDGEGRTIEGYIARFDSESLLLFEKRIGKFYEVIKRGAFSSSLERNDIRALINHDDSRIIGRTKSGTLQLTEDNDGLRFSCTLPDTSYARDLEASLERGDLDGCSFGFEVTSQDIQLRDDGTQLRSILDLDLIEVSMGVTFPAYQETSVALRSIERWQEEQRKEVDLHRINNEKKWLALYR